MQLFEFLVNPDDLSLLYFWLAFWGGELLERYPFDDAILWRSMSRVGYALHNDDGLVKRPSALYLEFIAFWSTKHSIA